MAYRIVVSILIAVLALAIPTGGYAQDKQEKHPEITAALKSLAEANKHLEKAGTGFGGNKVKAQSLIREAEKELKEALAYAAGQKPAERKPQTEAPKAEKK